MKQMNREIIIILVIAILAIIGGWWYAKFQFDLCYVEITPDFWYCLQHAMG